MSVPGHFLGEDSYPGVDSARDLPHACSPLAERNTGRYFLQVSTMSAAARYIRDLAEHGRHHFTTEEAAASLGCSLVAARAALRRLKARGEVSDPYRGFHVIIPPEYRRLGCLPADQFVPQLLQHLGEPYYVALLSAAELHGAAHQRPQAFQVMVKTNRRASSCGEVRVQFIARKDLDTIPVVERKTPRGLLRIASPEATALELVGYADQSGGLDNVASVISELADTINRDRLLTECERSPIAWVQRLGFLLDLTGHRDLADGLVVRVAVRATEFAPLVRSRPRTGATRDGRWKLAVNVTVEPDL